MLLIIFFYNLWWSGKIKFWERNYIVLTSEAVVQRRSVKKVFLKISKNSQENTCARVSNINPSLTFPYLLTKPLTRHWRLSTILKTRNKSIWSNVFWYVKVYIIRKVYSICFEIKQFLKELSSDKINVSKNALSFLFELQLIIVLLLIHNSTEAATGGVL